MGSCRSARPANARRSKTTSSGGSSSFAGGRQGARADHPGTGFNSTHHTIEATRQAKEAGADAALVVCPYYNKPTQEGLYQHFKAVHDAVDLPIVITTSPAAPRST